MKVVLLSNGVRVEIIHNPWNPEKLYWINWNPGDDNFEVFSVYGTTPKEVIGRLRLAISVYYNPDVEKVRRRLMGYPPPTPQPSKGEKIRK